MNLLNIRSWADVRAFLYVLLPVVTMFLVGDGVLTDDTAQLWGALGTAVLGPVVAAVMARNVSTFRTAFYTLLGAVQALVIGYHLAQPGVFAHWMPLVVAIVGLSAGGVAAANTDTSPAAG
jgi:CHASE2 domain-containing sensor protein